MFKHHGPGGCCCGPCKIDEFAAETVVSSDVVRSAEHPQSPYPTWLRAEVKLTAGQSAKLFWCWDDATPGDGFYCELTPQNGTTLGTLKLFRKGGSQLGDTLNVVCADTGRWHRITACYDPDANKVQACFDSADERGYVTQNQSVQSVIPNGFACGRKAGYGGNGTIRNYQYHRLWYCGTGPGYTDECHVEGDAWDYYYDLPSRVRCHNCGSCTVIDERFTGLDDGPMPCGWDTAGTNWAVSGGKASGDGKICHLFDTTSGEYLIQATFSIGALGTRGDAVSVSLTYGSSTTSATWTRVAGASPTDPDRYLVTITPGSWTSYVESPVGSITLSVCPYVVCDTLSGEVVAQEVTPGPICVTIAQPTLAGHTDATLTRMQVTKSKQMSDECPECNCLFQCQMCTDGAFPSTLYVELAGLEPFESLAYDTSPGPPPTIDCDDYNTGWYLATFHQGALECDVSHRIDYDDGTLTAASLTCGVYQGGIAGIIGPDGYFVVFDPNKFYLIAIFAMRFRVALAYPRVGAWAQFWGVEIGDAPSPVDCLTFSAEQLLWIGYTSSNLEWHASLTRRWCGGGSGGFSPVVPSTSTATVTSL